MAQELRNIAGEYDKNVRQSRMDIFGLVYEAHFKNRKQCFQMNQGDKERFKDCYLGFGKKVKQAQKRFDDTIDFLEFRFTDCIKNSFYRKEGQDQCLMDANAIIKDSKNKLREVIEFV